uniref:Uncharacterized protein n=1 Tax=Anguilla anguilla TaxID=7936 RepID=A0A0E9SXM0_ANGAN
MYLYLYYLYSFLRVHCW